MTDSINGARSDNGSGSTEIDSFINQPKNPEWDCLLIACQKGDVSAARRILRENPSSGSHCNARGQSALHIAAWWNHVECAELLLEHGADVLTANSFSGATPLHESLQSNQVRRSKGQRRRRIECVIMLLKAKANVNALDDLGRVPLECFVLADKDDIADYTEIEELIAANERARNNPAKILLQKLISKECTMKEIDQLWVEKVVPDLDLQSTCTLLSTELSSMTEAWIDRAENASESTSQSGVIDNRYYSGCITWMWNKIFEVSAPIKIENKVDEEPIPDHLDSALQSTLSRLGIALFDRYEYLYKPKKYSREDFSLLQKDTTLSSWTELAILLMEKRDETIDEDGSSSSQDWTNLNEIQQSWMTIARRDYFDLAQLWWDRFKISPVGVFNRQGMTALQFAARSGHLRMVNWLITHPSLSNDRTTLLQWVKSQDNRGHTALAAAKANQHEQVVELLHDYTNFTSN